MTIHAAWRGNPVCWSPHVSDDSELLEAWRAGDKAAGSILFERHFDRLHAFLSSTVPDAADDLVQKTMLACIEGRDRIQTEFSAYMFGTARQLVYREYDRRQRDGRRVDYGVSSAAELGPSPSSVLARHQQLDMMRTALQRIPLDYQIALELYYLQGMRGPRIAEALAIPEGTVRGRLRRGLDGLRKRLAEIEVDPEQARAAAGAVARWESELPPGGDDDDDDDGEHDDKPD